MTRVRNADEFQQRFRKLRDDYDRSFGPRVANVRQTYAGNLAGQIPSSIVDECLEAHIRAYVVNGMLAALNWRLDSSSENDLPNLIPEAPIRSLERGTTRFLDYLGLECESDHPLLVVETKRPSASLPQLAVLPNSSLTVVPCEIVSRGLAGEPLMGEWSKWLTDISDYIRSVYTQVKKCPKRAVLTNGDWLILFLEPADAFLDEGTKKPDRILVFKDSSDIEQRCDELFSNLEYNFVLEEVGALLPGELPFFVTAEKVDYLMHGLHLRYIEQPGIYLPSPVIKVAPVIFLHSIYGSWLRVESPPREYQIPHKSADLSQHLKDVLNAAEQLLQQVRHYLRKSFQPSSLAIHYRNEDDFYQRPGVDEVGENEYLIVTGSETHYLVPNISVSQCPHHDWAKSQEQGVASNPGPITVKSIKDRSFFVSTEVFHCAHRDVGAAKACPITQDNRKRCGLRSGQNGQAFCEIWRFERYLCCRTCAFDEVCTGVPLYRIPCQTLTDIHAGCGTRDLDRGPASEEGSVRGAS